MTKLGSKAERQAKLQKKCDKKVVALNEHKHFRPKVHSKKIAWNEFPKTVVTSIDAGIDNAIRNWAYHTGRPNSNIMKLFFEEFGKETLEELADYPQRKPSADWRAYRWYLHTKLLPKRGKRGKKRPPKKLVELDKIIKEEFNKVYRFNSPFVDSSIWPEEMIA